MQTNACTLIDFQVQGEGTVPVQVHTDSRRVVGGRNKLTHGNGATPLSKASTSRAGANSIAIGNSGRRVQAGTRCSLAIAFRPPAGRRRRLPRRPGHAAAAQCAHTIMYKQAPKFITNREYIMRTSSLERC